MHSQMLGFSLILLAALATDRFAPEEPIQRSHPRVEFRWLYPSLIAVHTTLFSFPQVLTRTAHGYREAWA